MLCCRWSARFSISKPASRSAKEERRGAVDRSPKRGRFAVGGRLNSGVANPCSWRSLGLRGSKTPTSWSTERVVRCRIVEIGPFQRRQLNLARPESAFPQVGKNCIPSRFEFMRAQLAQLTTNYGFASIRRGSRDRFARLSRCTRRK